MTSLTTTSSLTITWVPPDLAEEEWEFFHHPVKQEFYLRHGIDWQRLSTAFARGRLVPYPRGEILAGMPVRLAYAAYDDYARYLARAKRGYRLNYNRLEEALQRAGTLVVKAPIVLACADEALLFAGYRRLCLAWNYGMVPAVWLVPLTDESGGAA